MTTPRKPGDVPANAPDRTPPLPAGDAPTLPPSAAELGTVGMARPATVPGYEVLGELGRGGMGVVYKARQLGLDRLVALKMILAGSHAGPEHLARFSTEARAIANLRHPNVVQIYQVGEHEGKPFLTLEYVEGGSLAQRLDGEPWDPADAAVLVEKLARAVAAVHDKGIVHRDLKPGNVLLTADGEPKITDFGLAKQLESGVGQTASNAILGTPSYMAPEQTGGRNREIGPPADVYALGAILYELLTGRPPFVAETPLDTIVKVVSEEPVSVRSICPAVPRDLETICLKCLAKKIPERYPSAAAVADDLRRFSEGEPIAARPPGFWRQFGRWRAKNPGSTVSLGIALGLLLLPALFFALLGNLVTIPAFVAVLAVFVRPHGRTAAAAAAVVLGLGLLSYLIMPNLIVQAVNLAEGIVPALIVGTAGRAVAWALKREVLPTTLGSFFGSVIWLGTGCCGAPLAAMFALGMDKMQAFQEFNQQGGTKTEEEMMAFYGQFDYTWPLVIGVSWFLISGVMMTGLGALAGAAAAGRKLDRAADV